jgi:copper chaperone CopZ
MDPLTADPAITRRYVVGGMTCHTCARHVETALEQVPGVHFARVDFPTGLAAVEADGKPPAFEAMRRAVADAGYQLLLTAGSADESHAPRRPIVFGLLAIGGLLALYLGLITLAQGWSHAVEQLIDDRWFVGAIAAGFGTQVGLFAYLRTLHGRAAAGGVAASTGTSTAAMLACCAHHLTDILPILGISGAAVFLNLYKTPLLWLGIAMNVVGITYMLWHIRRQRASMFALDAKRGEKLASDSSSIRRLRSATEP